MTAEQLKYLMLLAVIAAVYLLYVGFIAPLIARQTFYRKKVKPLIPMDAKHAYASMQNKSFMEKLTAAVAPIAQRMNNGKSMEAKEKQYKEIAAQLYSAGLNIDPGTYIFMKNMITVIGILVGGFLAFVVFADNLETQLLVLLMAAAGPYILTRFSVTSRITKRKSAIESQLPDVLDLLSIAVDAGMGFDQALDYVTKNMQGPLIDELTIVSREMSLGKTRGQAFQSLSDRMAIDSVTNFSAAIVQATAMGIPIRNILESQAESVRSAHIAAVKQKAAKATIKMLLPMVAFIFPVLFIILLGPAALSLLDNFM